MIFQSKLDDSHDLVQNTVGCLANHVEAMVDI